MGADRKTVDELLGEARERLKRIEPREALAAVKEQDALLVDIRADSQRERDGTVPDARFFPRNVLEWRADPSSSAHDPAFSDFDRKVIVMCDEGYASSLVAATLKDMGFDAATDLVGGFQAWRKAGLPVDSP